MKHKNVINSDIEKEEMAGNKTENEEYNRPIDTIRDDAENTTNPVSKVSLPDDTIEMTDQVSKLEADLTTVNDKYLRLYSEFENYKRRVSKDRIEQTKMAAADIFLAFLPVIDDLERALKSVEESKDNKSIIEGLKLIYSKIKNITSSKGLKEMESAGKPFDAELHDAIANAPAPSADLKGKVVEEIEKGYFLGDKVIRHAKVIVGN